MHNFFFIFVRGRHARIHVCTSLSLSCLTSLTYLSLLISCCQYDFTFNRLCTTITELCGLTLSIILGLTRLANSMSGNLSYNAHAWSSAGAGCKVNSSVSLWCQQLSLLIPFASTSVLLEHQENLSVMAIVGAKHYYCCVDVHKQKSATSHVARNRALWYVPYLLFVRFFCFPGKLYIYHIYL